MGGRLKKKSAAFPTETPRFTSKDSFKAFPFRPKIKIGLSKKLLSLAKKQAFPSSFNFCWKIRFR